MLKTILNSFLLALDNIRTQFFHTVLSVLGIVIGVAALVSILSLIDGMEAYAREQITSTTSLKMIGITTQTHTNVNNVRLKKDTFAVIDYPHFLDLKEKLQHPAGVHMRSTFPETVVLEEGAQSIGAMVFAVASTASSGDIQILAGDSLTEKDIQGAQRIAAVNINFLKALQPAQEAESLIGKNIKVGKDTFVIRVVISNDRSEVPRIYIPITVLPYSFLRTAPPEVLIEANDVEDVPLIKEEVTTWLKERYPSFSTGFNVFTNEARVAQAAKGFRLFRVIMGLIVGISVVVGGIGVMNVLLISVTERTVEIGIRKAVGANKSDIVLQFLSESVTISVFGSTIGALLGVGGTMAILPIIRALTDIPFYATYTWNTLLIISVLAVFVGVLFGTYPALRASKLDPVEAIRRE